MLKEDLDERLLIACDKPTPDLDEIKELIIAGADLNQLNKYGESIFDSVFLDILHDNCEDKKKTPIIVENIKEIISLMVENGWDI